MASQLRVLSCLLATFLLALPLSAQEQEKVELRGVVVDRNSGDPVSGVYVQVLGQGAYTDPEGNFRISGLSPGIRSLVASHLGYATYAATTLLEADGEPVRVELEPNPVMLQGIQVMVDRMKRRRNAAAVSVRAYDEPQMRVARDAYDFLRARFPITRCPTSYLAQDCVWRRGNYIAPTVYVDEMPNFGGLEVLSLYPTSELHTVEVYSGGTHIRVYTKYFAERLARGRAHLTPVLVF